MQQVSFDSLGPREGSNHSDRSLPPLAGASGQAFVQQALARDPSTPLVLYVRSPNKLPAEWKEKPNVKISVGELTDDAVLDDAMKGVQAVACFLVSSRSVSRREMYSADHAFSSRAHTPPLPTWSRGLALHLLVTVCLMCSRQCAPIVSSALSR